MAPGASAQNDYRELVCSYFTTDCDKAMRVVQCESHGDPQALNLRAGYRGLFQVDPMHIAGDADQLYDPETNVRIAHGLWRSRGWAPWPVCGSR